MAGAKERSLVIRKIYVIGALKNPQIPVVGDALRATGHEVFDNWYAAGPTADDHWREYEIGRGHSYLTALASPEAQHNFAFDKKWLDWADTGVLVLPAGKSAHIEAGYLRGQNKDTYVLFEEEPTDRYDLMYQFFRGVFFDLDTLVNNMGDIKRWA